MAIHRITASADNTITNAYGVNLKITIVTGKQFFGVLI